MNEQLLPRTILVSLVLHLAIFLVLLSRLCIQSPRVIGAVEVGLLALERCTIGDGRKPGVPTGSLRPAGRRKAGVIAPRGHPALRSRVRRPRARVLPPRRVGPRARIVPVPEAIEATRLRGGPGRVAAGVRPASGVGLQPLRAAASAAGTAVRLPPVATRGEPGREPAPEPRDGSDAPPMERMTLALVRSSDPSIPADRGGAGSAADSAVGSPPGPDVQFAHAAEQPGTPGADAASGLLGKPLPLGDLGTGGATTNRGFLPPGLLGEYYADPQRAAGDYPLNTPFPFPTFTKFVCRRYDSAINFAWNLRPPAPGVPGTYFSVRWTGRLLVPAAAQYTFYLEDLDDAARLFIDGKKVIDCWVIEQKIPVLRNRWLSAGVHDFRVDYCQGPELFASIRLCWSSPSLAKEIIFAP